jgi:asparagine synthase (glutamine-hydrolysing)
MCGICGKTSDPGGDATAAMNAALVHRGPDDGDVHRDAETGVAIGARRLSIIDVAGGHQPLSNERGDVWAALNGEIYNHPALQERLRREGHVLASRTDTEVLVHLYEEYGDELVHALEGMFAFAIWDAGRRRLLLARDRFGEKPLFYSERDGVLTFASELDAVLAGTGITLDPDPEAIDAFFVWGYVPGPRTIARGVRQLPPGHVLVWDAEERASTVRPYWSPMRSQATRSEPVPELVADTRELLERSVRSRLISDVPLGVFLSGGTDSTLIAALAARVSDAPVSTFTVGYDVGSVNETHAARETADAIGTDHRELVLSSADVATRVPELLGRIDQPLADHALVSLHAVAELARRHVTVAVGGEGADELFGGYPRYRWIERASRLEQVVPAALAQGGAKLLASARLPGRAARLADVLTPRQTYDRHVDWVTDGRRALRSSLYGPGLAETQINGGHRLGDGRAETVAAGLMALDQGQWLPDDVLFKADRAGMFVSLEIRTPYLHREIAEFAAAVPTRVHLADGGKALLRAVLRQVAPEVAGRRPKTAFRVPVGDWLRGPLAPLLETQVREGAIFENRWFDRERARQMVSEHASGAADRSRLLWPLLALGLWLDARS